MYFFTIFIAWWFENLSRYSCLCFKSCIHEFIQYTYTNIGTYILVLYDIIFSIYCTTTVWYLTPYNEAFAEEFLVDAKIEHKHTLEPSVAGRMEALLQKSRYEEEVGIWEVLLLSSVPRQIELWAIVSRYPSKNQIFESSKEG